MGCSQVQVLHAMLPDESRARAVLGDDRCAELVLEMDTAQPRDPAEVWAYISSLASFESNGFLGCQDEIDSLLDYLELEALACR